VVAAVKASPYKSFVKDGALRVGELIEANRRLETRVAELERRLNRTSRNSSLPPSQDPPSAPPRPRRSGSGGGAGGQPGHEGKNRRLLPLERIDEVVEHWPARCARCRHRFSEAERIDVASPQRHQVAELPPIAVQVTEHRLHRVRCRECGREARAELPATVPRSAFGARLQAAVATLVVRNRVSRRDTVELMGELFGRAGSARLHRISGYGFEISGCDLEISCLRLYKFFVTRARMCPKGGSRGGQAAAIGHHDSSDRHGSGR